MEPSDSINSAKTLSDRMDQSSKAQKERHRLDFLQQQEEKAENDLQIRQSQPIDKIWLTERDLITLRISKSQSVPMEKCGRLYRFCLVEEETEHIPGYMPKRLGTCRISEKGKDYLVYYESTQNEKRSMSVRYWITTIIALAALLKSFLPEISAGLAWLWTMLEQ